MTRRPKATPLNAWLLCRWWDRLPRLSCSLLGKLPVSGARVFLCVRCPMPLAVVLALAVAAWTLEWRRHAVCLLLGFEGLLALRCHLALPCDSTSDTTSMMAIPKSKTSTRTLKMQSILVADDKLVALLNYIYSHDAPRTPLCPGGLRGLQRRLVLEAPLGHRIIPMDAWFHQGRGRREIYEEDTECAIPRSSGRVAGATSQYGALLASIFGRHSFHFTAHPHSRTRAGSCPLCACPLRRLFDFDVSGSITTPVPVTTIVSDVGLDVVGKAFATTSTIVFVASKALLIKSARAAFTV
eukprot:6239321-Amphidinium_carterae.1